MSSKFFFFFFLLSSLEGGLWVATGLLILNTQEVGLQKMVLAYNWTFFTYFFRSPSLICMLYTGTPSMVRVGFLTELMKMITLLFLPLKQWKYSASAKPV